MKSNAIFVKFHTWLQSTDFVLDKILIHEDEHEIEDEDEKYQIKAHAYALTPYMKLHCQSFFFD